MSGEEEQGSLGGCLKGMVVTILCFIFAAMMIAWAVPVVEDAVTQSYTVVPADDLCDTQIFDEHGEQLTEFDGIVMGFAVGLIIFIPLAVLAVIVVALSRP